MSSYLDESQRTHGLEEADLDVRHLAASEHAAGPSRRIDAPADFSILRRYGPWRDALRRRVLAGSDSAGLIATTAALLIAGRAGGATTVRCLAFLPIWILLAKLYGLYDSDHRKVRHLTADELPRIVTWTINSTAALSLAMSVTGARWSETDALRYWCIATVAVVVLRAAARIGWRRLTPPERVVILGSGPLAHDARRKLELFSDTHSELVGTIPDKDLSPLAHATESLELVLARMLGDSEPSRVIVATQVLDEPLLHHLVAACRRLRVKLSVVPPARGMFGTAVQLDHVADLPLVAYNTWDVPRSTLMLKRAIDIAGSLVGLILLSPLLIAIALIIRLDSRGGSLFIQRRAGRFGSVFTMYKFRTMSIDAPERLEELVSLDELAEPMFKLRADPRVTRVGRFLRRSSLDELPQLFNVLKGDMSLVGPRPEQIEVVCRYEDEHFFRLDVRPGLTGPMQVFGRGELTFGERLSVEREYVENLSLRRDFTILLMTSAAVVKAIGAY